MAIENLPRPWVLAALTGLKVSELLALPEKQRADGRRERGLPRPDARRQPARETAADRQPVSLN
jgi:hypothetical protein